MKLRQIEGYTVKKGLVYGPDGEPLNGWYIDSNENRFHFSNGGLGTVRLQMDSSARFIKPPLERIEDESELEKCFLVTIATI